MTKRTSEISAKWLLSGCAAEVLLCDLALWMPPPFNGKRIPHCNRWSREILLQVTNWAAEIPLYSCLFLLLWAQQVHWVSQLRDYSFNSWNYLVLQNWKLFHAPDKHEAILQDKASLSVCQNLMQILKSSRFGLIKNKTTTNQPTTYTPQQKQTTKNPTKNQPKSATNWAQLLGLWKMPRAQQHLRLNIYRTWLLRTRIINYTSSAAL